MTEKKYTASDIKVVKPKDSNMDLVSQWRANENRVFETVAGVSTTYNYGLNDCLVQTGGSIYAHDDNGNTLTETLDGTTKTYTFRGFSTGRLSTIPEVAAVSQRAVTR